MEEFNKIVGRSAPVVSPKDDCFAMLDRLTDEQVALMRSVMSHFIQLNATQMKERGGK